MNSKHKNDTRGSVERYIARAEKHMKEWSQGEDAKLSALTVIGIDETGNKHFLAIEDGHGEWTQRWREVLLKLKQRGMNTPQLVIGGWRTGVLGRLPFRSFPVCAISAEGSRDIQLSKQVSKLERLPYVAP